MIFLYRIDLLPYEAAGAFGALAGVRPTTWLLTSYERALSYQLYPIGFRVDINDSTNPWRSGAAPLYEPTAGLSHAGLRLDDEKQAGELALTLPLDHAIAQLYYTEPPTAQVWCTVAALPAEGETPLVVYSGRVRSGEVDLSTQLCTLKLAPVLQLLQRPGLTRTHSRTCGHTLYDEATCRVDPGASEAAVRLPKWREDGFATSVSADGVTLVVPEAANRPDGWFVHGMVLVEPAYDQAGALHWPRTKGQYPTGINWAVPQGGIRRSVVAQSGTTLTLATPVLAQLQLPARVSLYAGCDKTKATCQAKFGNYPCFGGYPYQPTQNPFETGIKA